MAVPPLAGADHVTVLLVLETNVAVGTEGVDGTFHIVNDGLLEFPPLPIAL